MKFAAFDIEIANELPFNANTWNSTDHWVLPVLRLRSKTDRLMRFWQGVPRMTRADLSEDGRRFVGNCR